MSLRRAASTPLERSTLANGLRVVVAPDRTNPLVAVAVVYDVGFRSEPEDRTGFAHLFEHLMFQGSENVGKVEHLQLIQSAGGVLNGHTRADVTAYYEALPSKGLELALWLEADRMARLALDEENLQNQISVVKEEIKVNVLNQPYGGFPWIPLPALLFDTFPNAHNGYGDFTHLEQASLGDAADFYATYYTPANAVLVVVGDCDPEETVHLAERHFAGLGPKKQAGAAATAGGKSGSKAGETTGRKGGAKGTGKAGAKGERKKPDGSGAAGGGAVRSGAERGRGAERAGGTAGGGAGVLDGAGHSPPHGPYREPPLSSERRRVIEDRLAPQPAFVSGYRVPDPVGDTDAFVPYIALSHLLSDGDASRLRRRLVHGDNVATDVACLLGTFGSDAFLMRDPIALQVLVFHPGAATTDDLLGTLDEELSRLAEDGPEAEELERVAASAAAGHWRGLDEVLGRAVEYASVEVVHGRAELVGELPDRIAAVGADAIAEAASTLLAQHRCVVELVPAGQS